VQRAKYIGSVRKSGRRHCANALKLTENEQVDPNRRRNNTGLGSRARRRSKSKNCTTNSSYLAKNTETTPHRVGVYMLERHLPPHTGLSLNRKSEIQ